jgi:hypothetical protein
MRQVGNVILFAAGAVVVVLTLVSAVRTTMLPRGVPSRISRQVFLSIRLLFRLRAGRMPTYERRDRIMATYAPVSLLALLSTWLVLLVGGYTAMYVALGERPVTRALELSGSSIFTLGTTSATGAGTLVLTYTEAGLGLLLLTLLITYLPSLYTTFQRRESAVTLLEVRAGAPPWAVNLLVRYHRIEKTDRLGELWQQWEGWFADVEESHVSFPALAFFRSPEPDHSWVTAAGTVLDTASLWASTVEHPRDPDAQLLIRAGTLALRRIAGYFDIPFDPDPRPDAPITISRFEYDEACRELAQAGVPLRADLDAAWRSFAGWRVNYDTPLLDLARLTEAPIAPWTSDRSPVTDGRAWTLARAIRGTAGSRRPRFRRRAGRA